MMEKQKNYSAMIRVPASPKACFNAVANQMNQWWTQTVEGGLHRVGDRVTAIFPPGFGHWTFEAVQIDADARIEMVCVDAHHRLAEFGEEIDQEWLGTRVIWEFADKGANTEVSMTHVGLTPELKCWDICMDGWNHFFKTSLKNHLSGEAAVPHKAG